MRSGRQHVHRHSRRAAVVVQVALFSFVMVGMGAMAIDIGAMYTARAELQAAADSAALAAAAQLMGDGVSDPEQLVRETADEFARRNAVFGTYAGVELNDVQLGRSVYDSGSGQFSFQPGGTTFDAVRVTVRRSEGSEGGPLNLMFAHIFGQSTKSLWARSSAVLIPRDIAVVIDLSNSMNWDSQLRFWNRDDGGYSNLRDIWAALDGPEPTVPYIPGVETATEYASDSGPTIGIMSNWGDPLVPGSYSPYSDPGLWYIRKYQDCNVSAANSALAARGYSSQERYALLDGGNDSSYATQFRNRTAVILGFAEWHSGKDGGYDPDGGNGNDLVGDTEISWKPTPDFRVDWSWSSYINWCQSGSLYSGSTLGGFRYRYGLKTFTDFLLESEPQNNETDILWATPQEPLRAVKDAVQSMTNVIVALDSLDHVSLEIFASTSRHEVNLTDNLQSIPARLYQRQSGHYDRATNMGGGIARAIAELNSSRARGSAHKVIMLMSDGVPNVNEWGQGVGDSDPSARQYALDQAQIAADQGFRIYTVSVGYQADRDLMQEIASIGHGQEFFAIGNPEEYSEQLQLIFRTLGGKRPVALIE